jgi:N-acetylmuramoyl-L-alanine amidase
MTPPLTVRLLEHPDRGALTAPEGVIVHAMGALVDGVPAWDFLARGGVEAHRLIDPAGAIVQAVPDDRIAWHAGQSRHGTSVGLNRRTLGVELLVAGSHSWTTFARTLRGRECPFPPAQLHALAWCCRDWAARFPSIGYILGHEHVSGPWVREDPKPDPGPWLELGKLWLDVWGVLPTPPRPEGTP